MIYNFVELTHVRGQDQTFLFLFFEELMPRKFPFDIFYLLISSKFKSWNFDTQSFFKPDKPLISFHLDVGKEERIKLFCAVRIWRTQIINYSMGFCGLAFLFLLSQPLTTDTQCNEGKNQRYLKNWADAHVRCGRQNMLLLYLKTWDWIFSCEGYFLSGRP